jgi:hypothetical protein
MMNLRMVVLMVVTEMRTGLGGSAVRVRVARQASQRVFQGAGDGHGELGAPDGHGSLGVPARGV